MGKVIRSDRTGVQRIRARDIVPGDVVEVAGTLGASSFHWDAGEPIPLCARIFTAVYGDFAKALWPKPCCIGQTIGQGTGLPEGSQLTALPPSPALVPRSLPGFPRNLGGRGDQIHT